MVQFLLVCDYLEFALIYGHALWRGIDIFNLMFLIIMHLFALGLMFIFTSYRKKSEMEETLYAQNKSINLLLAENERHRIGQDLHDSLGHVFAMLSIKSELAVTLLDNHAYDKARKEIAELNQITQSAMHDVREIVENLKAHTVSEELKIIENMLQLADIDIKIVGQENLLGLTSIQEETLSMVLRELTNNLLKHSEAKNCQLVFTQDEKMIYLTFEDDGKGFDRLTGQELHTIRDRMIRQEGQVEIISQQKPTKIKLTMAKETR